MTQALRDYRIYFIERIMEEVIYPRQHGTEVSRTQINHLFAIIGQRAFGGLTYQMGRKYPGSHLATIKCSIYQLVDKPPFSFGKFGKHQDVDCFPVGLIGILHNVPFATAFIFQIVGGADYFPFVIKHFLSGTNQIFFIGTQQFVPTSTVGISRIRYPFLIHHQYLLQQFFTTGSFLQKISFCICMCGNTCHEKQAEGNNNTIKCVSLHDIKKLDFFFVMRQRYVSYGKTEVFNYP